MRAILLVILLAAFAQIAHGQTYNPQIQYGNDNAYVGAQQQYICNPQGCTFVYWSVSTGSGEILSGSNSTSVSVRWLSSGTIYAHCDCPSGNGGSVTRKSASMNVTVSEAPPSPPPTTTPPPVPVASFSHCRESGNIPLSNLGLSLSEGSWSGPGISGDQIQISGLQNNIAHTYTYTRTSDQQTGTTQVTVHQTNAGQISVQATASCPTNLQGSLSLVSYDGAIEGWRVAGGSWGNAGAVSITYNRTASTTYEVSVKKGQCQSATTSLTIDPIMTTAGDINTSLASPGCNAVTGSISVSPVNGNTVHWERSTNDYNWTTIQNSASNSLTLNETNRASFRAAVQQGNCPIVYSPSVQLKPTRPIGGVASRSSGVTSCGVSSGTLVLSGSEGTIQWQKNDVSGWEDIAGATASSFTYSATVQTRFRAKLSTPGCADAFSQSYTAYVSTQGGTAQVTTTDHCATAIGYVSVNNDVGEIKRWEYSQDGQSWSTIEESYEVSLYHYNTTQPHNYYRAVVQLGSCEERTSYPAYVSVSQPPDPGIITFSERQPAAVVDGVLTFYPKFTTSCTGTIDKWVGRTDNGTFDVNTNAQSIEPIVTETTGYRVQVSSANCPPILSGETIMGLNAPFVGVHRVLGMDIMLVESYDGYSYEVANAPGISLQPGFSFIANSGQNFFILIDGNYAFPPVNENYVLEETILVEGKTSEDDIYFSGPFERESNYTYFDGLGRPLQQVARRASPNEKDMVTPIEYDAFGRVEREYLPFESTAKDGMRKDNAVELQSQFYLAPPDKVTASEFPFARTVYEASPLNRVLEQGAPGLSWQPGLGHTVRKNYGINTNGEVMLWQIDESTGRPKSNGHYAGGTLYINETIDEHGSSVKEYVNLNGKTLEKRVQLNNQWVTTVYIYDDFDLLRFVIQPEGVRTISPQPDDAFLNKWAFQYRYDGRKRMVAKRVPGADWVFMVYDDRDRLVFSQDGNQRTNNEWLFTKYDALNRPIITGMYNASSLAPPSQIATPEHLRAQLSTTNFAEQASGDNNFFGYTNNVFPNQHLQVLTVTYYDNYDFPHASTAGWNYDDNVLQDLPEERFAYVKGLITGTQTRVVGTDTWLRKIMYYDDRYRLIQTIGNNYLEGVDRESSVYNFAGRVIRTNKLHQGAEAASVLETFAYDHAGRMLGQTHKVNNEPTVVLKENAYNAIGQLVEANLHLRDDGSFFQSVDYRYTIRGWLSHINNAALEHDLGITNDDGNDFFGFELRYDNPTVLGGAAQFNGNISEARWKNVGGSRQSYAYQYDPLNRLTSATFMDHTRAVNNGRYNETIGEYDFNGNIQQLSRGMAGAIDALDYMYDGNRLLKVSDTGLTEGFRDGTNPGDDYHYDHNGNLNLDENKDIATIHYNYLNLPREVVKKNGDRLEYVYDAAGTKLRQVAHEGSQVKTTDYNGVFVYENNDLQFLQHSDGRVVMKDEPTYEYFLKDHLGNVRVTFTTTTETSTYRATLDHPQEDAEFLGLDEIRKVRSPYFDHTFDQTGGDGYALRLSGGPQEKYGISKTLQLMPGDKVHMEVYAKYLTDVDKVNLNTLLGSVLSAISGAAAGDGSLVVDGIDYTANQNTLPTPFAGEDEETGTTSGPNVPKAFLKYIFVPDNYDFSRDDAHAVQVTEAARMQNPYDPHELLTLDFEAPGPGHLVVYLVNENETMTHEVFFDDFRVEHEKSSVVQMQDYYAFGLAFNSYNRENSVAQDYKYNGKEEQKELGLGWLDYGMRMYQPELGRFFTKDRFAEKYRPISPYQYAANNPVRFIDVNGDSIDIYDNAGKLVMTLDDGKKESTGIYFQKTKHKKDGSTVLSGGVSFAYNDEGNDREKAKNGDMVFEVVSDSFIEGAMEKSGVNDWGNKLMGWEYLYRESSGSNRSGRSGGKMDYWASLNLEEDKIYIVQSKFGDAVGYNDSDFGNFLWGLGTRRLGFSVWTSQGGAHANNAVNGQDQNAWNPNYEHQILDSNADQQAIRNGYFYNRRPQENGIYTHDILKK